MEVHVLKQKLIFKYSKKVLALALSLLGILSLASCGAGDVGREGYVSSEQASQSSEPVNYKPASEYRQDFDGMLECMNDRGYIQGSPTLMAADIIGAKRGYRYKYTFEKSDINIEFYEYDTANLNDKAKSIIDQISIDKHFNIQDNTIDAVLSNNHTCLMIYNYSKDDEANLNRAYDVENLLKEFKTL